MAGGTLAFDVLPALRGVILGSSGGLKVRPLPELLQRPARPLNGSTAEYHLCGGNVPVCGIPAFRTLVDTKAEILGHSSPAFGSLLARATGADLFNADTPLQAYPFQDRDELAPSSIEDLLGERSLCHA